MPKRPRAEASSSPASPAAIRQRLVSESQSTPITIDSLGPLAGLRVHIIDAKLSDELDEPVMLRQMAEHLGANVNSSVIDEADVIVTRITALKRLQRHIDLCKAVRVHSSINRSFLGLPRILERNMLVSTHRGQKMSSSRGGSSNAKRQHLVFPMKNFSPYRLFTKTPKLPRLSLLQHFQPAQHLFWIIHCHQQVLLDLLRNQHPIPAMSNCRGRIDFQLIASVHLYALIKTLYLNLE
jgi:hypothetical protein